MGDYQTPSLTAYGKCRTETVTDYSSNGDKCIKATLTENSDKYIGFRFTEGIIGESISFSIDTWSSKSLSLHIYIYYDGSWKDNYVTTGEGFKTTVLSVSIPDSAENVWFRVDAPLLNKDDYFYTDNWCLKIQ